MGVWVGKVAQFGSLELQPRSKLLILVGFALDMATNGAALK